MPPAAKAAPAFQLPPNPFAPSADWKCCTATLFQDLLDWGVPAEAIQQAIGEDLPPLSTVIRNFATQRGLQFSTLKTTLQAEVDKTR